MTAGLLYAVAGVAVFCLGVYAFVIHRHLLRKILAFNVMGSGVFLVLIATARRHPDPAPDPVPHAMVLTGIVVAVSVTAFGLALARRIHAATGRADLGGAEGDGVTEVRSPVPPEAA